MEWPIVSFAMLAAALAGRTLFAALATAAGVFALVFAAAGIAKLTIGHSMTSA